MKEPLTDSRRVTAKSILKLIPKKEHHNTTFTCQAQNTADRNYRAVKLKLEVSVYPPSPENVNRRNEIFIQNFLFARA